MYELFGPLWRGCFRAVWHTKSIGKCHELRHSFVSENIEIMTQYHRNLLIYLLKYHMNRCKHKGKIITEISLKTEVWNFKTWHIVLRVDFVSCHNSALCTIYGTFIDGIWKIAGLKQLDCPESKLLCATGDQTRKT